MIEVDVTINDHFEVRGTWDNGRLTVPTDGLPDPDDWHTVAWTAAEEEEISVGICHGCWKTYMHSGHPFTRRAIRACVERNARK